MNKLISYIKSLQKANVNLFTTTIRFFLYKLRGKNIIASQNTTIKGLHNIKINEGYLRIACVHIGFVHSKDKTFINVEGKLIVDGSFDIGKGCRFDIGKNAIVELGRHSFINPFTNVIITHGLHIGDNCSISWYCQFLDNDFHQIQYEGKKLDRDPKIHIGNHVWIGSYVSIYKGVKIPNGCIVASNSVVKDQFDEENVLIAGNPAKIIKRNISWEE